MKSPRILVVDDEYGVRTGIRQILELEGYQVEDCKTGKEALEALNTREFDVVLLDLRLPDIDGLTVLRAIKQQRLEIMVCMITAYASIDTAVAATREGADFFLPKPFLPEDLLGVVQTLVRHRQARIEAEQLRKQHEASLRALAEEKSQTRSLVSSLRDAVLVINRDCEVVLVNPSLARLLNTTEEEVLFQTIDKVLRNTPFAELCELLTTSERERTVLEITVEEKSYLASVVAFRDDNGLMLGRILTISDITDLRRMAMEKERFIRTMVHELKSPLAAIRGLIEVVTDRSLGNELDPYLPLLARAEKRVDALARLISDLLSLSRSEQPHDPTQAQAINVREVLEAQVESLQEQIDEAQLRVSIEAEPNLPPVFVVPEDLNTVIANLLSNAVKYNRPGGSIVLSAYRDGAWVRIDVKDTGIGIAQENLPRLFTEFFREKRPETRDREGSGLGLAIVKRLVERAGGRVAVTTQKNVGSTFSVLLPS